MGGDKWISTDDNVVKMLLEESIVVETSDFNKYVNWDLVDIVSDDRIYSRTRVVSTGMRASSITRHRIGIRRDSDIKFIDIGNRALLLIVNHRTAVQIFKSTEIVYY